MRLHFLALGVLALAGCGPGEEPVAPEAPREAVPDAAPDAEDGGAAAAGPRLPADERLGLAWVARRPYRVDVRVAFVDFPSRSAETASLLSGLASGLSSAWGERVRFDVAAVDPGWTAPIFESRTYWDLSDDLRAEIDRGEPDRVVVLRFARRRAETELSYREIDPRDGLISAVGRTASASLIELHHGAVRTFEALFGQEGFLLEKDAHGEWSVLFRAAAIQDGSIGLTPGALFQVHRRVVGRGGSVSYPPANGTYFRLDRIGFARGRLEATGTILGLGQPAPGDKLVRLFLPGGSRPVHLVDPEGQPVEGYSVFVDEAAFSTEASSYVGLSDGSGRVLLPPDPGCLSHLSVMRTVRGTPYVFHRSIVHGGEGLAPVKVVLPRVDRDLEEKAGEAARRRVSSDELENRKRRASMYLVEAELYIRQGEYRPAQDALRKGIDLLESLDNPEIAGLLATFLRLREKFDDKVVREEEIQALESGRAMLEKADRAVLAGEFEAAQRLLDQAASTWPRNLFPEAGRELDLRRERVAVLRTQQGQPLGGARRTLLVRLPRLDPDTIDDAFLTEARAAVERLGAEGLLETGTFYSDLEILQFAKRTLDELADRVGSRAVRAKRDYDEADGALQRQRLYDIHRGFLEKAHRIDELLRAFPKADAKSPPGEGR